MGFAIDTETRAAAESLLAWWHDAGVDVAIDETPCNWMAPAKTAAIELHAVSAPSVPEPRTASPMPMTLPDFLVWLASDTTVLEDFSVRRRLAAEGDPASSLMVVADMPERDDVEAKRLLTGECGALFDKMLSALGRDRAGIYLATLAPARTPTGRVDESVAARLAPILNRHIALVAPKNLWLMGDAVSRAVLGMSAHEASGRSHKINHDGRTVQAIATVHPQVLTREPKLKARVWKDMQLLIEESKA